MSHLDRMQEEMEQLNERIVKLTDFLDTPTFDAIEQIDQSLLSTQLMAMMTYSNILEMRLLRAKPEPFTGDMPPGLLDAQAGDEIAGDCA